jgi:hypothetical protein
VIQTSLPGLMPVLFCSVQLPSWAAGARQNEMLITSTRRSQASIALLQRSRFYSARSGREF